MLHLQNKSQNKETHFNEIPSILNKFHHAKKYLRSNGTIFLWFFKCFDFIKATQYKFYL